VKAQAFSLQVLTSLAVGGQGLAGLVRRRGEREIIERKGRRRRSCSPERERERENAATTMKVF